MSRDTTYVVGTIVEAEFLNELQEVQTGTTWGLKLNQPVGNTDGVQTEVTGDAGDSRSSIIIGGQRRWLSGNSPIPAAAGLSGPREIRAWTDDDADDELLTSGRDYNIEIYDTGAGPAPLGTYSRVIGTGDWDAGASTLHNIRLTNGVQADAFQQNSFVFQTIGNDVDDVALELRGKSTQDSDLSKMLSVGIAGDERVFLTSTGIVSWTPDLGTNLIFRSLPGPDTANRVQMDGDGQICWGDGTLPPDVCLERLSGGTAETLQLSGTSGNGIFDTIYIQNSDNVNGTLPNTAIGYVNIFDLNIIGNAAFDGSPIDLTGIAHLDLVETFTAAHSFDAQLNMLTGNNLVFAGDGEVTFLANTASTNFILESAVAADTNTRFAVTADGCMYWGPGNAAADVEMCRGGANYLEMALGDQIRVQQDPVDGNDLVRRDYVDNAVSATGDDITAFAFFVGS